MRTEQEILKDFEKLGWHKSKYTSRAQLILEFHDDETTCFNLEIDKYFKAYRLFANTPFRSMLLPLAEDKLLHELFERWGRL